MASRGRGAKAKGSRAERKVAEAIRHKGLDPNAGRMPLSGADSHLKGDVRTDLSYTFEVKCQERICFWDWWGQAKDQAHYHPPVLCITSNHRPMLAVVELDTLLNLMKCEQEIVHGEPLDTNRVRKQNKYKRKVSGEVVERE